MCNMFRKWIYVLPTFQNANREKQVIVLMISNGEEWHYFAVKKLSATSSGITSKRHADIYCLNCHRSFATKNKLESHRRIRENKDFCDVVMPSEEI